MGHEFSGSIDALGKGVTGWNIGERVAAFNIVGCGQCRFCQAGNSQCCPTRKVIGVNTGINGAFAEFVTVPAENLARLDEHVPYEIALLNEPLAVAYHALQHLPTDVQSLVIVGGGTIGQCLAKVARVLGKWKVFLLEPVAQKRQLAEREGAVALPPDLDQLKKHLPEGADAAIEAVGLESTVQTALEAIRPGGTVVLLGNLALKVTLPLQHISSNEKHLVGTYGFNARDFKTIVGWINERRFDLEPMISGSLPLEETPQAFEELASGRKQAIKLVVVP
jgi:(R,R)-butanediol dehydrogenase/meso-butanediol dehydrogenase/diacetyl reductase